MENNKISRPDFEQAESRIAAEHEKATAKRLAQAAWNSFDSEPHAANISHIPEHSTDEPDILRADYSLRLSEFLDGQEIFGKHEPIDTKVETTNQRLAQAESVMKSLIKQNFLDSARQNSHLAKAISDNELLLKVAEQESASKHPNSPSTRSKATDHIRDQIDSLKQQKHELASSSPEGYIVAHGTELRRHTQEIKSGEIATTPYVEKHLSRVERNMAEGRPTFLHGHLGSGKTELAITAAKHAAIDRAAYESAVADYQAYLSSHPDLPKAERISTLGRFYRKNQTIFEKGLRDGDGAAVEKFAPLVISGSKDLTSQDMFADKTLKLTKFNGKSILEHKADLDAEISKWQAEHPEETKDPAKAQAAANEILELYKLKNQAFGTEVENIKQAIYRGVEEGRPVIIDEINAIPTAVLISLNDVLQRRPGQNCYIPGVGPKRIQPGFSITMTGNLSSDSVNYLGTEELNPAFLSRLDIIEHDYLPMSETDRSYKEQANPRQNELFQVVVAYFADRQGNLELPEIDKSLGKLFALSQLAHETQLVFGGKWRESQSLSSDSGDNIEPHLEKSVLSIRNILNVLREWDKGSEKDIDTALWDGFIANMTSPDDQNFVLALAKRYGFFQENDGWQIRVKERGAGFTSLAEAHPGDFAFQRMPMETYSIRKTIEALYGPAPKREFYPEDIDISELESLVDDEMTVEKLAEFEAALEEISKSIQALEVLGQQCGCTVTSSGQEA